MFTDSHNHTIHYSPDARQTYKELILASRDAGLNRIAVTEHYELDYPHRDDPLFNLFDIDDYVKNFSSWKTFSASENGPELLMGIEFGYQSHLAAQIDDIASAYPWDVVLLSNHLFRNEDIYFSDSCYKIPASMRHAEYIGVLAEMADRCTNYDVIAHYDYVNRYTDDPECYVKYSDCPEEFNRLFDTIISRDKALEINTRSIDSQIKKGSGHIMPDPEIIRKYVAMGGKLITLGSDSHGPETLGIHFDETARYLKSLGINEIAYYRDRKIHLDTIS